MSDASKTKKSGEFSAHSLHPVSLADTQPWESPSAWALPPCSPHSILPSPRDVYCHVVPSTVRTMARMPWRMAGGSSVHRSTTTANSGSTCLRTAKISAKSAGPATVSPSERSASGVLPSVSKTSVRMAGSACLCGCHQGRPASRRTSSVIHGRDVNILPPRCPPRKGAMELGDSRDGVRVNLAQFRALRTWQRFRSAVSTVGYAGDAAVSETAG